MAALQINSISQANANHDLAELEKLVLVIFIASTKNPSTKKAFKIFSFILWILSRYYLKNMFFIF